MDRGRDELAEGLARDAPEVWAEDGPGEIEAGDLMVEGDAYENDAHVDFDVNLV